MPDFSTQILQAIQARPDGLSLAEVLQQWPAVPRRTMQRVLAQWVRSQKIAPIGKARATRYVAQAFGAQPSALEALNPLSRIGVMEPGMCGILEPVLVTEQGSRRG